MGERRNTQQRKVILEELRNSRSHPTAAELYDSVRRRLPRVSLGTVYRNLELLAQMGRIQKLDVCGQEARFDGSMDNHYHVRCVDCGRLGDVHGTPVRVDTEEVTNAEGFKILGYRFYLLGMCPECKMPGVPDDDDDAHQRNR